MKRIRIGLVSLLIPILFLWTTASTNAAPLAAIALQEGRTYDQAHDTGYIDWSGSVQYVYLTHRDSTALPPEEGGTYCMPSCAEWVTRIGNGGTVSGSFDWDVSYFEVLVAFSHDAGVGNATLRACSAVNTWDLYSGPGAGLPGFVSMVLTVPAGCRSWSLSASSGYVDFRSTDVTYGAPPPTPTNTSTPLSTLTPSATWTPTLTLTPTNTPTPTFTPTSTPTNTPSPTPTPLPPEIIGHVVCDLWGDSGWCKGNESLELTASDPQGLDVTISGDPDGVPFSCGNSCSFPLPEGIGTANYTAISTSGRMASGSSTWQRDATPPMLNMVAPAVDGQNGWYVSEVDLTANASDTISGLDSVAGSVDGGATWNSFPIHFSDGVFPVTARARDIAGNETVATEVIHADTVPPVSQITSHSNGEVVRGNVVLSGKLEDQTSGAAGGEISLDSGTTWQEVSMGTGDTWSFNWQSNEVPNGPYDLQMRGMDQAGNLGDSVSITLLVDNGPPSVSITEHWWIWESGRLAVSSNYFPIASMRVVISDPQYRWPEVVLNFDPEKIPGSVSWDRRFADGTLALSGWYRVIAIACDVHDLCGSDEGIVEIPVVTTSIATLTPSPAATVTITPRATLTATKMPATPTLIIAVPSPVITPVPTRPAYSIPIWQLFGLLGLFLAIASASVSDPRPAALDRLRESIKLVSGQDIIDSSKEEDLIKSKGL